MFNASVRKKTAENLAVLLADRVEIFVAIKKFETSQHSDVEHEVRAQVVRAALSMDLAEETATNALQSLADAANKAGQTLRWAQTELGVFRPLKKPDILASTALVTTGWLIETIFSTVSLFADGHLDLIPAMGFGATFSSVTVGLGIAAGGCLRYVGYRKKSPVQRSEYKFKRRLACFGFGAITSVEALMLLVGARVRVTGGHSDLFDFSDVGFFSTFGDGLALIIVVSAALSYAISILKGHSGFADIPDYADYADVDNQDFDDNAREIIEIAFDEIDRISEDAELAISEALDPEQDKDSLVEKIVRFNAAVENAKNELRAFAQYEWEQACYIAGEEVPKPKLSLSEFNKLLINPTIIEDIRPCQHLFDDLQHAQAEASAKVMTAHADYVASVQSVRFLPPQFPTE